MIVCRNIQLINAIFNWNIVLRYLITNWKNYKIGFFSRSDLLSIEGLPLDGGVQLKNEHLARQESDENQYKFRALCDIKN